MSTSPTLVAGRYRLIKLLGAGGMGRVWHAQDETLGRDVAVKEIVPPGALLATERDELRRRTFREARATARLSHPNVVRVYDVFETGEQLWIVMEYVRSRSLHEVLKADGPLDPQRAATVGLGLLGALRAAHRAGVLHRDVKPSNVLLCDDGRVVLTDFGIATVEGDARVTRSGLVLGSPAYIAPERARDGVTGPESDLWSLGATLYAAVEGRPPYERSSVLATLTALAAEEPDPPRNAGPLRPVLNGLLRKDPKARMTAADAERQLRRAVTTGTSPTHRPRWRWTARFGGTPAAAEPATAKPTPAPIAAEPAAPPVAPEPVAAGTRAEPDTKVETRAEPEPKAEPEADTKAEAQGEAELAAAPTGAAVPGDALDAGPAYSGTAAVEATHARRRSLIFVGVLVLIAALMAGGVVLRDLSSSGTDRQPAAGGDVTSPAASPAPNPEPSPSTVTPSQPPPAGEQPDPGGQPTSDRPPLPDGWRQYTDDTGFSVYVPEGWQVSREGTIVYFRGDGRVLGIDQSDDPRPDPVDDWAQQRDARRAAGHFPGYAEIRLEEVDYGLVAADWEFTFDGRSGERQHVNNRGVVVSDDKAYGFWWQTTDADWEAARPDLDLIFDSFQPVSGA